MAARTNELLKQDLLLAHGLCIALSAALTQLIVDHVKSTDLDLEVALLQTRHTLDASWGPIGAMTTLTEGGTISIQEQMKAMLDAVESTVRITLGLQPSSKAGH